MTMRTLALLFAFCALAACRGKETQSSAPAADAVSSPSRRSAAPPGAGDWTLYNGSLTGDRFSTLAQITTANVAQLTQACAFDTPDIVSFESGLVAVHGVLYFTAFNSTYAIDAATCQQKWKQTRAEPNNGLNVNRGVGYADGRVFRGTGDAHVLALDATTGAVLWDVGIGDAKKGESAPMAPIAWQNLVFVGNAGGDTYNVSGRIYALDAATGRVVWQFSTIPESGAARTTWHKASAANPPGGAATWTSYALDESSGTLYAATGNPSPDFVEPLHPGENLYATSVLALDAKTGRLIAFVQPTTRDFHDWDLAAAPALFTTRSGKPFVAAAGKDGYVYAIERTTTTGRGETGPDSTSLVVRAKALVTTRDNAGTPLTAATLTRFCPGSQGGVEWNGPAYHRDLGLLYVNAIDWCTSVKLQPLDRLKGVPGMPWSGMDDPQHAFGVMDPIDRWKGWVTAIEPESGRTKWKVQTPKPMVAGITATAGGLVFTGTLDGDLVAYDAQSGTPLWRSATGKAIGGGVITYSAGGKQYVAAAAGLNSPVWPVTGGPARVIVYSLP
jgi:alcohol dehydrogenase (cytochrome c)